MVRHTGEDFVNVECIAVASVLSFQPAGVNGAELYTPEAYRFPTHDNASLSQQILDITVPVTTRLLPRASD